MFSVIIPIYNKAPYVEKTLRSVEAQTFREFEVIIINDGSTDKSLEVVESLFTSLTPPLGGWRAYSQQNQGVSTARNNGVKLAKYPYICFLDADDWWAPTFLEEMKSLIDEFPDAGIYGTSYFKVKDGKHIPANIGVDNGFERGYINYCQVYAKTMWMPLWTGAVCMPKMIFDDERGFKPNLKLGEDFDLWVRVALKYPVAFLNRSLTYYNQDVAAESRAVGVKYYKPEEHMLFTDYGEIMQDKDFRYLYEKLAVYGLLKYYLADKNKAEVDRILQTIDWKDKTLKDRLYYRILPKSIVRAWFKFLKKISKIKRNYLVRIK